MSVQRTDAASTSQANTTTTPQKGSLVTKSGLCYVVVPQKIDAPYMPWLRARAIGLTNAVTFRAVVSTSAGVGYGISKAFWVAGKIASRFARWLGGGGANQIFQVADSIQTAVGDYAGYIRNISVSTAGSAVGTFFPPVALAAAATNTIANASNRANTGIGSMLLTGFVWFIKKSTSMLDYTGETLSDYSGRVCDWTWTKMVNPSQINHALIDAQDRMDAWAIRLADKNPSKRPRIPKCRNDDVASFKTSSIQNHKDVLERVCQSSLLNITDEEEEKFTNVINRLENDSWIEGDDKILKQLVSMNQFLVGKENVNQDKRKTGKSHLNDFLKIPSDEWERNIFITLSSPTWKLSFGDREKYQRSWDSFKEKWEVSQNNFSIDSLKEEDKNNVLELLFMWKLLPDEERKYSLSPDRLSSLQGFSNPVSAQLRILQIANSKGRLAPEESKILSEANVLSQGSITGWQSLDPEKQQEIQRIALMHFNMLKHVDKRKLLLDFSPWELEEYDVEDLKIAFKDVEIKDADILQSVGDLDGDHQKYQELSNKLNNLSPSLKQKLKNNLTPSNAIIVLTEKDIIGNIATIEEELKKGTLDPEKAKQLQQLKRILKERQTFVPIRDLQLSTASGVLPAQRVDVKSCNAEKLQELIGSSVFTTGWISSSFQWIANKQQSIIEWTGNTANSFCRLMGEKAPTVTQITASGAAIALSFANPQIVSGIAGASTPFHDAAMKIEQGGQAFRGWVMSLIPKIITFGKNTVEFLGGGLYSGIHKIAVISGSTDLTTIADTCQKYTDSALNYFGGTLEFAANGMVKLDQAEMAFADMGHAASDLVTQTKDTIVSAADKVAWLSPTAANTLKKTAQVGAFALGMATTPFVVTPILLRVLGSVLPTIGADLAPKTTTLWNWIGQQQKGLAEWSGGKIKETTSAIGNFLQKYWNSQYGIDHERINNFLHKLNDEQRDFIFEKIILSEHISQDVKDQLQTLRNAGKDEPIPITNLDEPMKTLLISTLLTAWDHLKPEEILAMSPSSYSSLPVFIQERIKATVRKECGLRFWERNNSNIIVQRFNNLPSATRKKINVLSDYEYNQLTPMQQKSILFLVYNSQKYQERYPKYLTPESRIGLFEKDPEKLEEILTIYSDLSPKEMSRLTPAQLNACSNEELLHAIDLIVTNPEVAKSKVPEFDIKNPGIAKNIITGPNVLERDKCITALSFLFLNLDPFQQEKLLNFSDEEITALDKTEPEYVQRKSRLFNFMLSQEGAIKKRAEAACTLDSPNPTKALCVLFNDLPTEKKAEFRNYQQMIQSIDNGPLQKALNDIDKEINLANASYQQNRRNLETLVSAIILIKEPSADDHSKKAENDRAYRLKFETNARDYVKEIMKYESQIIHLRNQRANVEGLIKAAGGTVQDLSLTEDVELQKYAMIKVREEIGFDVAATKEQIVAGTVSKESQIDRINKKITKRNQDIETLKTRLKVLAPDPTQPQQKTPAPTKKTNNEKGINDLIAITEASIISQRIKFHECVLKEYKNTLEELKRAPGPITKRSWTILGILTAPLRAFISLFSKKSSPTTPQNKDQ